MQLNVEEALKKTGHGLYNYAVLFTCCIISHASLVDVLGLAVILPAATCELELDLEETGLLASVTFIGFLSSILWGFYSDTFGRRKALLISTFFGFIFSLASSFSPNWQVLFAIKLIGCGFSVGGCIITFIYIGEVTGSHHTDKYISIINSFTLASDIVIFGLAYFILPLDFSLNIPWLSINFGPWRACLFTMALPLGLGFLMLCFLHESPKYLANIGESKKALKVLEIIYKINNGSKESFQVTKLQERDKRLKENETLCSILTKQIIPIFQPPLLWRTLQLFYLLLISYSTINVFFAWFPTLVNTVFNSYSTTENMSFCDRITTNISSSYSGNKNSCNDEVSRYTIYSGIIYSIFFTTINLVLSVVAKWRKWMLIGTLVVSAISGILLNIITQPIFGIVLFALLQTTGIGVGNIASYFVDTYTTSNRSLVTSLGIMLSRAGSFAGTNIVSMVILDHCNLLFYSWSLYVITGIATALFLPDYKKPTTLPVGVTE